MKKKVFMVMSFSNTIAKNAYDYSIKKICEKHNLEIRRADEILSTNPIYDDIVKEIKDASIIIVDISDNSPNVFYELGMAHTLKQNQTIIITQSDYSKTPFDIAHFRIIKYENTIEGKENLEKQLDLILGSLLTDYKLININTYELIINVMMAGKRYTELATLLGIRDYKGIVKISDKLEIEYTTPEHISLDDTSIETNTGTMIKLGYLKITNDIVDLTEEGKAFAEVLESRKEIICNIFNDQILTPNYSSFAKSSRFHKKKKPSK